MRPVLIDRKGFFEFAGAYVVIQGLREKTRRAGEAVAQLEGFLYGGLRRCGFSPVAVTGGHRQVRERQFRICVDGSLVVRHSKVISRKVVAESFREKL